MPKIKVYVEGRTDKNFIENYLIYIKSGSIADLEIVDLGGKDKLKLKENDLKRNTDLGGINLVIFDANNDYNLRWKELTKLKKELDVEFELFLLPNNKDNGELENLLCEVINKKHEVIFDCFKQYEDCLSIDSSYYLPNLKSKIFAYVDALTEGEELSPINFFNKDHWDLDNPNLDPLKAFLLNYFK